MKKICLLLVLTFICANQFLIAQNGGVSIGKDEKTVHPKAILEQI